MRRMPVLCMMSLLLTVACAAPAKGRSPGARPATPASSGADTTDQAQIYAAVLRRYLTTPQDNSNLTFATVFVLDHADAAAADPMRTATSPTAAPISTADQRSIITTLRDVATVQFVATREQVIISRHGCGMVRDNGILILLGPPTPVQGTVHVGINGYVACLGATWFTYVVAHHDGGWLVTGTTGPVAIS